MVDVPLEEYQERIRVAAEAARARGVAVILLPATVRGILGALEVLGLRNTPAGRAEAIAMIGSQGQPVAFGGALRRMGGPAGQGVWAWRSGAVEPRVWDLLPRDVYNFRVQGGYVYVPVSSAIEEPELAWARKFPRGPDIDAGLIRHALAGSEDHRVSGRDAHLVPLADRDAWARDRLVGAAWDDPEIEDRAARE